MTKTREEELISTVGEMKGLLERLVKEWDATKGGLASSVDVSGVRGDLDKHIEHHKWSVGQLVAILFGSSGLAVSIFSMFRGKS